MNDTDAQLKELYDELDDNERKEKEELKALRAEKKKVMTLLDSYGIPAGPVEQRVQCAIEWRSAV